VLDGAVDATPTSISATSLQVLPEIALEVIPSSNLKSLKFLFTLTCSMKLSPEENKDIILPVIAALQIVAPKFESIEKPSTNLLIRTMLAVLRYWNFSMLCS
jgi:hypothetical protein